MSLAGDSTPGEQAACCEADVADCRVKANGETMALARCEASLAECKLKIKEPKPDPPCR